MFPTRAICNLIVPTKVGFYSSPCPSSKEFLGYLSKTKTKVGFDPRLVAKEKMIFSKLMVFFSEDNEFFFCFFLVK